MKLVVDRGRTKPNIYSIEFGPDFDILILREEIWMPSVSLEAMSEIDRIITKSAELKYCVMYMKHPLLQKSYGSEDLTNAKGFFNTVEEHSYRSKIRHYFAMRLIHRRRPVELYEFGHRLFKD